jgi:hypothetical protein
MLSSAKCSCQKVSTGCDNMHAPVVSISELNHLGFNRRRVGEVSIAQDMNLDLWVWLGVIPDSGNPLFQSEWKVIENFLNLNDLYP